MLTEKLKVSECATEATTDYAQLSSQHQAVLAMFFWVQKAASQLYSYRRNVPLLHTSIQGPGISLHVISFTRPSPTLVLQVTNAEVRRPGYEGAHK